MKIRGLRNFILGLAWMGLSCVSVAADSLVSVVLQKNISEVATNLESLGKLFDQAAHPPASMSTGWYSGRCFSARSPGEMVSGLLVLLNGHGHTKFHIPAYALDSTPDMWDELDQSEIDRINEYNFVAVNDFATSDGSSLVSGLKYEYESIGKMYLREKEGVFYLKMANNPPEEDGDGALKFYCYFDKKVK